MPDTTEYSEEDYDELENMPNDAVVAELKRIQRGCLPPTGFQRGSAFDYENATMHAAMKKAIAIIQNIKDSGDCYKNGYQQALADINTPQQVIQENWNPSKCPGCHASFHDYEPCNDGYYKRAHSLERCPFCGQKLEW